MIAPPVWTVTTTAHRAVVDFLALAEATFVAR